MDGTIDTGRCHIGGITPIEPTATMFAMIVSPSLVAPTNTVAPFVTNAIVAGLNVTTGAAGGTYRRQGQSETSLHG
jgi:hypothetical protein